MLRNFSNEVEEASAELCTAMRATPPSKQFGPTIMLLLVNLSFTKERIRKANLNERRELIHEFDRNRQAIQKGMDQEDQQPPLLYHHILYLLLYLRSKVLL